MARCEELWRARNPPFTSEAARCGDPIELTQSGGAVNHSAINRIDNWSTESDPLAVNDSLRCNPKAQKAPGGCVVSKSSGYQNRLYFGDNLDVLRAMPAETVDLIYLDPPFNSNANYNVL
jgi:hypothetical protein